MLIDIYAVIQNGQQFSRHRHKLCKHSIQYEKEMQGGYDVKQQTAHQMYKAKETTN